MKFNEINNRYTQKVAEFLMQGYTINTTTMGGTQGEIAHIDLTDGQHIVRVMVEDFYDFPSGNRGITVKAGMAEESIKPNSSTGYQTIWNNRLTELYSDSFYQIGETRTGEKFYGTKEEADAAWKKHCGRVMGREVKHERVDITDKALEIGVKAVSRHYGIKRPNKSKVRVVRRPQGLDYQYDVYYGDKHFGLH